jgi:hypothetical protein
VRVFRSSILPFPLAGSTDFSLWVFRLILACAAYVAGAKPHRLKSVLLGPFFARGVFGREENRTLRKNREECGTRKFNPPPKPGPPAIEKSADH